MSTAPVAPAKEPRQADTNIYRLSTKGSLRKSIFLSKIITKKHGSVQLESVGTATADATKVAQILTKHGYTHVKSIRTEQFAPTPESARARFQVKLIIVLEKTAEFDKLTEDILLNKP